jgi:hypothetical protein
MRCCRLKWFVFSNPELSLAKAQRRQVQEEKEEIPTEVFNRYLRGLGVFAGYIPNFVCGWTALDLRSEHF